MNHFLDILLCKFYINIYSKTHAQISEQNFVSTVPADGLAPNGARPSADT